MFKVDSRQVRALLLKRGLTIKEFADRCGLNFITARRLVHDDAEANIKTIGKVSEAFAVDAENLLLKEE